MSQTVDVALTVLVQVVIPDDAVLLADATDKTQQLADFIGWAAQQAVKIEAGPESPEVIWVETTPVDVNLRSAQ